MKKWRNWNPCALLVEIQNTAAHIENSLIIFKKLWVEFPYDLAIQLLHIYLKEIKTEIQIL